MLLIFILVFRKYPFKEWLFETRELGVVPTGEGTYKIYSMTGDHLGIYSTKEKALKVLDMIQKEINVGLYNYGEVFEMPLDEEVEEDD
jgi:hypothetical protein